MINVSAVIDTTPLDTSYGIIQSSQGMQDNFYLLYHFANCFPVTLKCTPGFWDYPGYVEKDLMKYMDRVGIEYLLTMERGLSGNLHYHGILLFPTEVSRKRFQVWFNKGYGKFYVSDKGDPDGWYSYIMKGYPLPNYKQESQQYLFDPVFEPQVA